MSNDLKGTKFMESIGFKLLNVNWSWGAFNEAGDKLLLRQNIDEFNYRSKEVRLLGKEWSHDSNGRPERLRQLREFADSLANNGKIKCYAMVIIGKLKDGANGGKSFEVTGHKNDRFFPITEIRFTDEGEVYGVFGNPVPVQDI